MEYFLDGLSPGHGRVDLRGIHPEGAGTEGLGKDTLLWLIIRYL